jgi:hypothetical protein
MRASDRDRNKVAAELRVHCLEGRISVEELDQRLARAMSAQTVHELAETVYDLPTVTVRDDEPRRHEAVAVGPPGVRPFTRRLVVPARLDRTRDVALDTIAPAPNVLGYELRRQSPIRLEFERTVRSTLGLMSLGDRQRITISFENRDANETSMIIHGRAPRRVRKAFAQLRLS